MKILCLDIQKRNFIYKHAEKKGGDAHNRRRSQMTLRKQLSAPQR